MTWERRSREILLKKLKASGSSGVLLTNIVFLVSDQRQIPRQIDHLIVTENKVILIENKGWKGLVFDGVLPSSVHKSYQSFIDERPLHQRDTFAVQLRNDDNEPRFEIDDPPTQQAASQARDLKNLVKRSGIPLNLTVCVFYSHQDVDLRAATCQTKWNVQVLDTDSITDVLPRPTNSAFIPVEDIVNVLDPYTSNITGFGDYTDTWPDML